MRLGVPVRRCLCVPINTPGWRGTLQGTSLKPLPKTQVSRFFETEINIIVHYDDFQSGEGEVARTLISHRYGSGSIPGSGDTCRLCFFFFFLCARPCFVGFSVGSPVLLPRKNQHSHFFFLFYLRSEDDQLGESQYESVNQVEAAKLLGSPNSKNNTRFQPPPENCEYAVVNKANKRVSS